MIKNKSLLFFTAILVTSFFYACDSSSYFSFGGSASGITGNVVLANNGKEITINKDGAFTFPEVLVEGRSYSVTIQKQPSDSTCKISNGSGVMTGDITNIGLSCSPKNPINAVRVAKYIYVVNAYTTPAVSVCALNETTGAIGTCQDAGGASTFGSVAIQGIVLNHLGTVAYLSNGDGSSLEPYVYQCQINATTHLFSSCTSTSITTPVGYEPYEGMLGINPTDTILYLTDDNGRVLSCPIVGGVVSATCSDSGVTGVSFNVTSIAVNRANTTAYVGNFNSASVVNVCTVSGSALTSCISKTGGSIGGTPFTFQSVGSAVLSKTESTLYIVDDNDSKIYGCATTPSMLTTFNDCFLASSVKAYNIVLNEANTVAYLSNYGTDVFTCAISSDGTFSSCTSTTLPGDTVGLALGY